MTFWQYVLGLLGLLVVLILAYWKVLIPWGDWMDRRRAARERNDYNRENRW